MKYHSKSVRMKITALFLVVIMLLSLATTASVYAENEAADDTTETEIEVPSYFFEQDGIKYLITGENTVSVHGIAPGHKFEETITLDKVTYEGKEYSVTEIYSLKDLGTGTYTVVLGEKVEKIGNAAFKNCENTTIQFKNGETIKSIGDEAFKGVKTIVNSLKDFENLTMVGADAFDFEGVSLSADKDGFVTLADGKLLYKYEGEKTELTLPESVTTICGGAFKGNTDLVSVDLNKATVIGNNAFNGCSALKTLTSTDNVTAVGQNAFKGTVYLEELASNDGFCRMSEDKAAPGYGVLVKYTGKATEVSLPNDVKYLSSAFEGNEKLTKVIIPTSVETICNGAFAGCSKLAEVILANNMEEGAVLAIGSEAFAGTTIHAIFIPTQVIHLAYDAFKDCENLSEVQVSSEKTWLSVGGGAQDQSMVIFDKYTSEDQKRSLEDEKGLLSYINMLFGWIMLICSKISGGIYLIALFIFAVVMKIILFPFGIKQQKSMIKQANFRPKEMAIQAKYKGRTDRATMQKMQQEIMEARQKENIGMMSGCLPLLLQLPILLILFNVIMNPLQYICGATTGTVEVLTNRAINLGYLARGTGRDVDLVGILRDHFADFEGLKGLAEAGIKSVSDLPNFTIGSFDLAQKPELGMSFTVLIPIITFVVAYYSSKLTKKMTYQAPTPGGKDEATSMKIMDLAMPALSAWFCFMYPAVIGCYWIFQNILATVQQWILKKMYPLPVFTEEDYKKAEKELMGKAPKKVKPGANYDPNRPKVRSLHHIDDDDDDLPPLPAKNERKYEDDDDDSASGGSPIGKADLK